MLRKAAYHQTDKGLDVHNVDFFSSDVGLRTMPPDLLRDSQQILGVLVDSFAVDFSLLPRDVSEDANHVEQKVGGHLL